MWDKDPNEVFEEMPGMNAQIITCFWMEEGIWNLRAKNHQQANYQMG